MSKHRVLGFKPQLRLEWPGQDGQNETKQPDHSASLGDSITSSTRIRFSVRTTLVRDIAQGTVEAGPALGFDLFLQRGLDLPLAARPQFHGDAFSGAVAEAAADIGAADDEILAVIGTSPDQNMDMWIVGIPVIDRHPVELRSKVALVNVRRFSSSAASSGETMKQK